MSHDLHYAPLCRETVDQALAEKNALLDCHVWLLQTKRALDAHPDIIEIDGAKIEDLLCDVAWEIDARVRAIAEYCDPPRDEPEHNWPANRDGARF